MKNKSFFLVLRQLTLVVFVTLLLSCSSDGSDGSEGPQGADGPAGPAGPKGDPGTSGVMYSEWLDIGFKPDTVHRADGGIDTVGYYATINAPKLTKEVLNTADVKTYINAGKATDPLIYSLPYYDASSQFYIETSYHTGGIEVYSNAEISTRTTDGEKYLQYRYMIIPGGVEAAARPAVDWTDYAQARSYLQLKD